MKRLVFIAVMLAVNCTYGQSSSTTQQKENLMKVLTNGKLEILPSSSSSEKDFDFLIGHWNVINTKRAVRLEGNNNWNEFKSQSQTEKILRNKGNVEKYSAVLANGPFEGCAVRLFNPTTKLWSIYWVDSKSGKMDEPVVGSFANGIGEFYGLDTFNGKPVLIRFNWNASDPARPIWSQAFSIDQGKTWEWNWYMHFSKSDSVKTEPTTIGLLEIRNYLIKEGKRTDFANYFQQHLIKPQIEMGGYPVGEYQTEGNPDRFVWLRGFKSWDERSKFLPAFYYGNEWKKHRQYANSLLLNNDDVHLLKPLLGLDAGSNTVIDLKWFEANKGIAVIEYYTANQKRAQLINFIKDEYLPVLHESGVDHISFWIAEDRQNDFPQLPVFQDQNLVVSIAFYKDTAAYLAKKKKALALLSDEAKLRMADAITIQAEKILYSLR